MHIFVKLSGLQRLDVTLTFTGPLFYEALHLNHESADGHSTLEAFFLRFVL